MNSAIELATSRTHYNRVDTVVNNSSYSMDAPFLVDKFQRPALNQFEFIISIMKQYKNKRKRFKLYS